VEASTDTARHSNSGGIRIVEAATLVVDTAAGATLVVGTAAGALLQRVEERQRRAEAVEVGMVARALPPCAWS